MGTTGGLLMIVGAIVVGALLYRFDKGQSIIDKLFRFVIYAGCIFAFIGGLASVIDDSSSDIGDRYGSEDEINWDSSKDVESSSGDVSFKGRSAIADYDYGACNSGCGCTQYAHYPGQTACVNCAENGCTTNKFGHEH